MSKIYLPSGGPVTINDGSGPLSVSAYGSTASDDIIIRVNRSLLEAGPENIIFAADAGTAFGIAGPIGTGEGETFDRRLHDLDYEWSFGDTTSPATFSAPVNLPAQHNTTNRALGPVVAHVFPPGTYTVRCTITNPATLQQAFQETTIKVKNPDTVFPGAQTLFVDAVTADNPAMPSGAVHYPSFDAAWEVYQSAPAPVRILFARGQKHEYTPGKTHGNRRSLTLAAARGTGTKPVLRPFANTSGDFASWEGFDMTQTRQIAVQGLRMENFWDGAGTGSAPDNQGWPSQPFNNKLFRFAAGVPKHLGLYDTDFDGWSMVYSASWDKRTNPPSPFSYAVSIVNCSVTNWQDYGVFDGGAGNVARGGGTVIAGCRIAQNPAAQPSRGKTFFSNRHGPYRGVRGYDSAHHQNDYFNTTGWSSIGNDPAANIAVQPCIRFNTDGAPFARAFAFQNHFEGANAAIASGDATGSVTSSLMNGVAKYNTALVGHQSATVFRITYGGWTFENNLAIRAAVDSLDDSRRFDAMLKVEQTGSKTDAGGSYAGRIRLRHNTMINLASDAGSDKNHLLDFDPVFTDVSEADNLFHAPNTTVRVTTYEPLSQAEILNAQAVALTPRYIGYRNPAPGDETLNEALAHPPNSIREYTPQRGSFAYQAAEGAPYRTYLGTLRKGNPNIGSV